MRRPSRRTALLLVAVSLLAAARYATWATLATGLQYWVVDERSLGVIVVAGPQDSCAIARTAEDSDTVRIVAECRGPFVPLPASGTAVGIPYVFAVTLKEPLGIRPVLDGVGNVATRCAVPRCGLPD